MKRIRTKALSLIAVIFLVVALIPAIAPQALAATTITSLSLGVDTPMDGRTSGEVSYLTAAESKKVTVTRVFWSAWRDPNIWDQIPNGTIFRAGETYLCTVIIMPKSGYAFPGKEETPASVTISGKDAVLQTNRSDGGVYYTISFTAQSYITSASASVTAPIGGSKPEYTAFSANGGKFVATVSKWARKDPTTAVVSDIKSTDTFIAGNTYYATVRCTPSSEYAFELDRTATINGKTARMVSFDPSTRSAIFLVEFVATYPEEINRAYATVTAPIAGANPDFTTAISDNPAQYTVLVDAWFNGGTTINPGPAMTSLDSFVGGNNYIISLTFVPKPGYRIVRDTDVYINSGFSGTSTYDSSADLFTYRMSFTAPLESKETITAASVTVTAPVAGAKPDLTTAISDNPSQYTVSSLKWYLKGSGRDDVYEMASDDTFVAGKSYVAEIRLSPNSDYTLSTTGVSVKVNGISASRFPTDPDRHTNGYRATFTLGIPEENLLSSVSVTVTAPAAGNNPDFDTALAEDSTKYTASFQKWHKGGIGRALGDEMAADDVFIEGETYVAAVNITANPGYGFSDGAKVLINDNEAVYRGAAATGLSLNYAVAFTVTASGYDDDRINVTYDKSSATVSEGDPLTLTATHDIPADKLGTVTYQWRTNTINFVGTSTEIPGATGETYSVPTGEEGVNYYLCVVVNVKDGKTTSSLSSDTTIVMVTVISGEYVFPFEDVPSDAWFYSDVVTAHRNGLINGKTATEYKPDDNMTIAEVVKLAACMHELYYSGAVTLENGAGEWYSTFMDYALAKDIIEFDISSSANDKITREQFVYIFYKALPAEEYTVVNSVPDGSIPDVEPKSHFAPRIYEFYRAGILTGNDDKGTFNPATNIKRSEVAAVLTRMFDPSTRKSITLT